MENSKNKIEITILSLLNLLSSISILLIAYLSKLIIDYATSKDINNLKHSIIILIITILLDILFKVSYKYIYYIFYVKNIKLYKEKVYISSLKDTNNRNITDYIQCYNEDINNVINYKLVTIPNIIYNLFLLLGSSILLLIYNYILFIVITIIMLIIVLLGSIYLKVIKRRVKDRQNEQAKLTGYYKTSILNKKLCKLYNSYSNFNNIYNKHNKDYIDKLKKEGILYTTSSSLIYSFSNLLLVIFIVISATLITKDLITIGSIALLIQLLSYIINPLFNIPLFINNIALYKASLERLKFNIVDNNINYIDDFDYILFENVSFSYDDNTIIDNFNLKIYKHDIIKIKGHSGSGKSTIIKLLLDELKPTKGSISVIYNNHSYNINTIYNLVAYSPQEFVLFNESIRTNFNIYTYTDDYKIYKLLELVNLNDRINNLDLSINDYNNNLSTGEKQRLMLAITLSLNKEILILDEYNSALDIENNYNIDNILNGLDKTIIYINHKDDILNNSKEILIK